MELEAELALEILGSLCLGASADCRATASERKLAREGHSRPALMALHPIEAGVWPQSKSSKNSTRLFLCKISLSM